MLLKLMKTFAFYIDFYLHIQGGALYIDGKNNKIYQCYFAGNSAPVSVFLAFTQISTKRLRILFLQSIGLAK